MSTPLGAKGGGVEYITVREEAILTTSYVASAGIYVKNADQLQLWVSFTKGSSDGCRLKIEYSEDDSTYFQETRYSLVANDFEHSVVARTILEAGNFIISLPIAANYVKISSHAISSGSGTLLAITAIRANL